MKRPHDSPDCACTACMAWEASLSAFSYELDRELRGQFAKMERQFLENPAPPWSGLAAWVPKGPFIW